MSWPRCTWKWHVKLSGEALIELLFWQENFAALQGRPLWYLPRIETIVFNVTTLECTNVIHTYYVLEGQCINIGTGAAHDGVVVLAASGRVLLQARPGALERTM